MTTAHQGLTDCEFRKNTVRLLFRCLSEEEVSLQRAEENLKQKRVAWEKQNNRVERLRSAIVLLKEFVQME